MELKDFINSFAQEFEETSVELFNESTEFKTLDEWNSLTALSIIAMVDERYEVTITGADLRSSNTIGELFKIVNSKKANV